MAKELRRMWVNQPSTLQPFHAMHGVNVLAQPDYGDLMRVYFLAGDTISQQMTRLALSEGWRPEKTTSSEEVQSPQQTLAEIHLHAQPYDSNDRASGMDSSWVQARIEEVLPDPLRTAIQRAI
jgi:hypothetical protein